MVDALSFDGLPRIHGRRLEVSPGRWLNISHLQGSGVNAETVVFFCHGGGGNQDQWRLAWRALATQGYSLVAWDLLGHGLSDKPRSAQAYAWSALVDDYLQVLERHAGPRNLLVGHSFGSGLTLSALLQWQARADSAQVAGVVLLGTQLHRPLIKGGITRLPVWLLRLLRPRLAKGFRERAWHPQADPALVAYEERLAANNRLDVFKALLDGAQWPSPQAIATLQVPISILAGETDGLTPPPAGQALHEHIPGSSYAVLPCGHQLMLEQPRAVIEAIERRLGTRGSPLQAEMQ